MSVTKEPKKLVIDLNDDEDEIMEYLIETRGISVITDEIKYWIRGREATIKEEMKSIIVNDIIGVENVKQLRARVKEIRDRGKTNGENSPSS